MPTQDHDSSNHDSSNHDSSNQEKANEVAFNNLVATLSSKENANMYGTLFTLLQKVPKLLEQVKAHADKISVLAPTNDVLAQLPAQLVKDLTSTDNNKALITLLEQHVVGNQTVGGGKLPAVVPISKVLVPESLKETVMQYSKPSAHSGQAGHSGQGVHHSGQGVHHSGQGVHHSGQAMHHSGQAIHHSSSPGVRFETDMVGQMLPKWLSRSSPGNNWT